MTTFVCPTCGPLKEPEEAFFFWTDSEGRCADEDYEPKVLYLQIQKGDDEIMLDLADIKELRFALDHQD